MLDLYYSTEGVLEQFNQNILLEAVNNVITRVQQIYSSSNMPYPECQVPKMTQLVIESEEHFSPFIENRLFRNINPYSNSNM